MKGSIFRRYFTACISLILVSFFVLGATMLLFASQLFKEDKYRLLENNVDKAIVVIQNNLMMDSILERDVLQGFLQILHEAIDADLFLTDRNGNTLLCTEQAPCLHTSFTLSETVMMTAQINGVYREQGTLGGLYDTNHYTVGKKIDSVHGQTLGYFFASSKSSDSLNVFLMQIMQVFLLSASIVTIFITVIIYLVTYQMVKPLKEMARAAQQFANEDFSARLPVSSYDEVGQLAMAMNHMAQSLSTLETMRRSFIANVSHELKTPMTTIGGFIDGVLDGTIPENQHKKYLRIVSDEVKRLSRLVRSMLNLAQIEAGEMKLHTESFDIVETVCQSLFSLEHQIQEKELEIRGLDHEKVYLDADPELIHQVLYNLIENAIKFANHGGYIAFDFRIENGKGIVSVRNSGEGLTKEETMRVFDRFYKTDRSRGMDQNGVGLGLHIVRSIINLHHGEVIVKSVHGEYCEFSFSLPLSKTGRKLKKN